MAMNKPKLAVGLALMCLGLYSSLMGIIIADGRGIANPLSILAISSGIASLAGGLILAVIGAAGDRVARTRP